MSAASHSARPILTRRELTPERLSAMLREYGCCLVRNLLSVTDVLRLRDLAKDTYVDYDAQITADPATITTKPETFVIHQAFQKDRETTQNFRRFGSLPLVYCPPFTSMLAAALERTAAPASISAYLGARSGVALTASSVRLSEHDAGVRRVFHQDGNFLGGYDTPTINCWVALDPCGKDAPGLEVFPFRIDRLLPAGQPGSVVSWEIDEDLAYETLGRDQSWIPEFQAGDAFIFDHTHVHRTHKTSSMAKNRHAIETWFYPLERRHQEKVLASLEEASPIDAPPLTDNETQLIEDGCQRLMDGDFAAALHRLTHCFEQHPKYFTSTNVIFARVSLANAHIEDAEREAAALLTPVA